MSLLHKLLAPDAFVRRLLDPLQSLFAFGARLYVSWEFLRSGYVKVASWDTTLYLFENEYHTPMLSPHMAAAAGAFGEILFPSLLIVGFMSRLGALGLFAVNIMAVISYSHVLLAEGAEGALGLHVLWGTLLMFLMIYGPGKFSIDHVLKRSAA